MVEDQKSLRSDLLKIEKEGHHVSSNSVAETSHVKLHLCTALSRVSAGKDLHVTYIRPIYSSYSTQATTHSQKHPYV